MFMLWTWNGRDMCDRILTFLFMNVRCARTRSGAFQIIEQVFC